MERQKTKSQKVKANTPVSVTRMIRLLLVLMLLTGGTIDAAQQPPDGPSQDVPMRPGQVQQLFDAMLVMQAREALALSEEQYARFLTRLKVLQDTRRRNQQERNRLIGELQRLTNPRNARLQVTEPEIKERLSALQELESRGAAELRKAYNSIDEVLDVRQQARFRVFEEQIERRKLELIGRARQGPNRQNPARKEPRN